MSAAKVREQQAYCQQKFHYYRNNLAGYHASLQEIEEGAAAGDAVFAQRWADLNQREAALPGMMPGGVAPPPGAFQFTDNSRDQLKMVAVAGRSPLRTVPIKMGTQEVQRELRDAVQEGYSNAYRAMRATFRYIKCLGWGGDGIASLWRYSPGPGQEHSVVMKMSAQWEYVARTGRRTGLVSEYMAHERDILTVRVLFSIRWPTYADEMMVTSNSDEHRT